MIKVIKCQIIIKFYRDSDRDRSPNLTVVIFDRGNNRCVFVLFLYFSNLSTMSLCNFISRTQFFKTLNNKGKSFQSCLRFTCRAWRTKNAGKLCVCWGQYKKRHENVIECYLKIMFCVTGKRKQEIYGTAYLLANIQSSDVRAGITLEIMKVNLVIFKWKQNYSPAEESDSSLHINVIFISTPLGKKDSMTLQTTNPRVKNCLRQWTTSVCVPCFTIRGRQWICKKYPVSLLTLESIIKWYGPHFVPFLPSTMGDFQPGPNFGSVKTNYMTVSQSLPWLEPQFLPL